MGARLAATVLVRDPETHQTVELPKGSTPEPRLAALVTNPAAWEGGKVPAAVRKAAEAAQGDGGSGNGDGGTGSDGPPPGPGQPDDSGNVDQPPGAEGDTKAPPKTPAKKTAASRPARRGDAADEGTGGE